jgi:hypothetical protein
MSCISEKYFGHLGTPDLEGFFMSDLTLDEKANALKTEEVISNAIVVANIVELVTGVIKSLSGKDIADKVRESKLTLSVVTNLVGNSVLNSLDSDDRESA